MKTKMTKLPILLTLLTMACGGGDFTSEPITGLDAGGSAGSAGTASAQAGSGGSSSAGRGGTAQGGSSAVGGSMTSGAGGAVAMAGSGGAPAAGANSGGAGGEPAILCSTPDIQLPDWYHWAYSSQIGNECADTNKSDYLNADAWWADLDWGNLMITGDTIQANLHITWHTLGFKHGACTSETKQCAVVMQGQVSYPITMTIAPTVDGYEVTDVQVDLDAMSFNQAVTSGNDCDQSGVPGTGPEAWFTNARSDFKSSALTFLNGITFPCAS
jgi:hypothetical protein